MASSDPRRRLAVLYVWLLAGLAALGFACAASYSSWTPSVGRYSRAYLLGVIVPFLLLAALQAGFSRWRGTAVEMGRSRARLAMSLGILAASAGAGLVWGGRIPEPRAGIFVTLWLPALAALVLFRIWGWAEMVLAGLGPLAIAVCVFAAELPRLATATRPLATWGDASSFAFLFPTREPYSGRGGRLRPGLGVRLRSADYPGGASLVTNAQGFRNADDVSPSPASSEYRILNLGDSFACGYGADQAEFFGSLLERALASRLGGDVVRVLNAEVSDPAYGLLYLQRHGLSFAPRLVIYGLSGNDVMQCAQFVGPGRRFRVREDGLLEPNPGYREGLDDLVSEMRDWYYPRACSSASQRTLQDASRPLGNDWSPKFGAFAALAGLAALLPTRPTVMPTFARGLEGQDGHKRLVDGYANLGHYYLRDAERRRELDARVFPLLRGLAQVARSGGAGFLLVVFPQRYQTTAADWEGLRSFWNLDAADFDLRLFNRQLAEFCAAEAMDCLDLVEPLRDAARSEALFLPGGDMHFNRQGHRRAAALAAALIRSRFDRAQTVAIVED